MRVFFIVHGFIQGVGYRYVVKKIADRYGIKGMARNAYDGSVEIVAEGDEEAIEKFEREIDISIPEGPQVHNIERYKEYDPKFPRDIKRYDHFVAEID